MLTLKKYDRFQKIINSATEQSFRNKKMKLSDPMTFLDVLSTEVANRYIAHEKFSIEQKNEQY
jgi:16S rRNA (uracil1498-N3)-methyltransferase